MTMRTLSPSCLVSTNFTGVAKSMTSRRLDRPSGSSTPMNSTMMSSACSKVFTTIAGSDRVTMMRPSPASPRRKSMFLMLPLIPAARFATAWLVVLPLLSRVKTTWLPDTSMA